MRMQTVELNGEWSIREAPLEEAGPAALAAVREAAEGWLPAAVPGEIHLDLMRAGRLPEPLVGLNAQQEGRWPETKAWWYRTTVTAPPAFREHEVQELVFDGLDLYAQVFLNGELLGESRNAFVPAVFDVRGRLAETNEVLVRLTAGTEQSPEPAFREKPEGAYAHRENFPGRRFLRKPQFTYGWDWVDGLPNIGIWRGVRLEGRSYARLRDLRVDTILHGEQVFAEVEAVVENLHPWAERPCGLELSIRPPAGEALALRIDLDAQVGCQPVKALVEIPDAQLWWPAGQGGQPLYHIAASLLSGLRDVEVDHRAFTTGLRTVEIDRSPLSDGSRFCLRVNGRDLFCKGANWIPPDAILARADRETYEHLVAEARAANMNMLRVWGGGIYEDPAFYEACDRQGILVWQDFPFACSPYPDDDPAFRRAVEAEASAAVRALRHHPSLALWCGNNENVWGFHGWWNRDKTYGADELELGGSRLYNRVLPEVCRLLDPNRPYWPSSPCGGEEPNSELAGDCHWWGPATMHEDVERRIRHEIYDECRSRFVSEYGVIGPCHLASTRTYLDTETPEVGSRVWQEHTNTFEKQTLPAALALHYADPDELDLEAYILYGQMFQAWMYGHSLEALRFRHGDPEDECRGALIWMYADCWGEVGWTVLDYYRRRKPSWYWLRRAFAPVKAIVRRRGRELVTRVVNDSPETVRATVGHGWLRLDGSDNHRRSREVKLAPGAAEEIAAETIPAPETLDPAAWLYAAWLEDEEHPAAPSVWLLEPFRALALAEPAIRAEVRGRRVVLSSEVYCHGVHVEDDGRALVTDNYVELLPGVPVTVEVSGEADPSALQWRAVVPRC